MKIRKGYKYQLPEPVTIKTPLTGQHLQVPGFVHLQPDGTLTINRGYAWDGPSGPTVDHPESLWPSLVHDVTYQLAARFNQPGIKKMGDWMFYRLMQVNGNPELRCRMWYWAVAMLGEPSEREEIEMPMNQVPEWS